MERIRLALINDQHILPIIGFDAIPVRDGDDFVPYLVYLSRTISEAENLPLDESDGMGGTQSSFEIFNFLTHQLLLKNQFDKLETTRQVSQYARLIHEKVDTNYLKKIVSIFPFQYFLNLTFTTHLSEVMQVNRSFPAIAAVESAFPFQLKTPKKPEDLVKNECVFLASIYNLFGVAYREDIRFNYYYSDDDMLDFISEFNKRLEIDLKNYKEISRDSSLLFLGCQYPDWLLRVLINTLKPGSLDANSRLQARVFIDYCNDSSTIFFLTKHRLQFQRDLQTRPFINNLNNVLSRHRFALNIGGDSNDYLFISYTRDNLSVVQRIVCQLAVESNIWFDRIKMFPGSLINDEVKAGISGCRYFLPVITQESIAKQKSDYVRQEWIYYCLFFRDHPKVIPLIHRAVNLGQLGFNVNSEFARPENNLFYVLFDDEGLKVEDVATIKNRL